MSNSESGLFIPVIHVFSGFFGTVTTVTFVLGGVTLTLISVSAFAQTFFGATVSPDCTFMFIFGLSGGPLQAAGMVMV